MKYIKKELPSYNLHMIKTDKFKSTYIEVIFSNEIKKENITINNFLSSYLTYSTKKYNNKIKYARKLEELYAASVFSNVDRLGKMFNVDFNMRVLNDKYTEDGLLKQAVDFLYEVLFNPNVVNDEFDKDVFKVIKNNEQSRIERFKENQRDYSILKLYELFDKDAPYAFNLKGYIKDLNKITPKNLYSYYKKRFLRILIPYWIFAVICVFCSVLHYALEGELTITKWIQVLASWILPLNKQVTALPYFGGGLWYIPVYACIVLVMPFLARVRKTKWYTWFGVVLISFFVLTYLLKLGWIQNVAFYLIWTYLGFFWERIKTELYKSSIRRKLLCTVVVCFIIIVGIFLADISVNMQYNKFPPNIVFFVYSIMMMSGLGFIFPYLDNALEKIECSKLFGKRFFLFEKRSFTVYLYQSIVFYVTIKITNIIVGSVNGGVMSTFTKIIICFVSTVYLCERCAAYFGKIEDYRIQKNKL